MTAATQETAAERWERWHATPKDPDRPLRTIREQRQLAQQKSAAVQVERREGELSGKRLAADRRLAAAGIDLARRYTPPKIVVPKGTLVTDVKSCVEERRAAWIAAGKPHLSQEQFKEWCWRSDDPLAQHVPVTFVNLEALRNATYLLGHEPLWTRCDRGMFIKCQFPISPPLQTSWSMGDLVLAIHIDAPGYKPREGWPQQVMHGLVFTLDAYDLCGHAQRSSKAEDPFYVPYEAVPWADTFRLPGQCIGLEGLHDPSLKRLVRWIVGAWVKNGWEVGEVREPAPPWDKGTRTEGQRLAEELRQCDDDELTEQFRGRRWTPTNTPASAPPPVTD